MSFLTKTIAHTAAYTKHVAVSTVPAAQAFGQQVRRDYLAKDAELARKREFIAAARKAALAPKAEALVSGPALVNA